MTVRRLLLTALLAVALAPALRAESTTSLLAADGVVFTVESGTYGNLFADAPETSATNPVLALDIVRGEHSQRILVPGTDGPEAEQAPALAVDRATNRVYLAWEGQRNIHSVLDLVGYSEEGGFGDIFEFAGDPFSIKNNPQLATTLDSYQTLDADGNPVPASRTILHLVWYDDGSVGQRVLYTPLVIEDGDVLHTNRIFDLQELATDEPATGVASEDAFVAMLEKPQIRSGRDGQSVVIAFVEASTGELSSLELRSVTGELVSFADKARAEVIEIGRTNPGLSRPAIADKARAEVIEIGRRLMRSDIADYLAKSYLDDIGASAPEETVDDAAEGARALVIETGVSLHRGLADKGRAEVIEIGRSADAQGTSHLLGLRKAARRNLPPLPDRPLRVFLSQKGDDVACAWTVDGTVRYRETSADGGWSPVRVLTLGPTLTSEAAYDLVAQRLAAR